MPGPESSAVQRPGDFRVSSADGTELAVYAQGPTGAPIIVLAHGWTLAASFFDPVVAGLVEDFRIITYDQRGHARSGRAGARGYTTTALAEDLTAVLEATVPAGRRAVLGGHSMGAMAILALASARPDVITERVEAALLASTGAEQLLARNTVVPAPVAIRRLLAPISGEVMSRPPAAGRYGALSRTLVRYSSLDLRASRQAVEVSTRTVLACPPLVQRRFAAMLWSLDLAAAVPRLQVPTHVVVGATDRLTPLWHSRRLVRALPDCTGLTVVPRVGHMTPVESPGVLVRRLRDLAMGSGVTAGPASGRRGSADGSGRR